MNHLFICAIGPVQDFISTARRSRDLWYGSWMLSELAKAAARSINQLYGLDSLIFPSPGDERLLEPGSSLNVANRIIAIVDQTPETVGELVTGAITVRLTELRDDALGQVRGGYKDQLAIQQIVDLPELYWAGVILEDERRYAQARDRAEFLLAVRKNTRDFSQVTGEAVPKSSLDGARESVIPEDAYPRGTDSERQRRAKNNTLFYHYGARQGERLSGVDILKRLGAREPAPKFFSTSHMAALPFLNKVVHEKGINQDEALLEEIRSMFDKSGLAIGEHDGALIYESRIAEWISAGKEQIAIREQLGLTLKKFGGESPPSPYYSLILADGDNMGKVIDAQTELSTHRQLSQVLSKFAQEVQAIIEEHQGVAVYAGGDDALAYLPLHTVLDCAQELERTFKNEMEAFSFQGDHNTRISPTLSAGIIVAHHLTPLSDVLEMAREAEKEAKAIDGKNGLAITISKRSGVDRTITGKWGTISDRLMKLIEFARLGSISFGTPYEFQDLYRVLSPTAISPKAITAETTRIIQRKRESGGGRTLDPAIITAFQEWLEQDGVPLDELAQEMIVARIFADAADMAYGPLETVEEVK